MTKVTTIKEKFKKRRNFKARHNIKTVIDRTEENKIKVEVGSYEDEKYDESNALVLPSKKRFAKKIRDSAPIKLLSKKQRKRLEKIVATKKTKASREEVLTALEKLHASNKKMPVLTSLQATQTAGRKKFLQCEFEVQTATALCATGRPAVVGARQLGQNTISSNSKRRRAEELIKDAKRRRPLRDPRVVCAMQSSSESSTESDEEIVELKKETSDVDDNVGGDNSSEDGENNGVGSDTTSTTTSGAEFPVPAPPNTSLLQDSSCICTTTPPSTSELSVNASTSTPQLHTSAEVPPLDRLPSTFVAVRRDPALAKARQQLPILSEEQTVMEAIREHPMTVIVGPTGSGKTTQVPQFLYEAGYASGDKIIGVTEPRRVAAIAMAARVGQELGLSSREVSYQIRFEGNTTPDTKIKFMTDGVLLKEFQNDQLLSKYSAVIIDEAHERSVYSDLLIGILSRVVPARMHKGRPLRLVVMSATLRVEDFTENAWLVKKLGGPPPVIKIEGRMFEVTVHYNKKTEEDYEEAAYSKVCKIHRQLPEGAILVFLTGQQEVNSLCRKLRTTFPRPISGGDGASAPSLPAYRLRVNKLKERRKHLKEHKRKEEEAEVDEGVSLTKKLLQIKVDEFVAAASVFPDNEDDALEPDETSCNDGRDEASHYELHDEDAPARTTSTVTPTGGAKEQPLYVLPLYSLLPPERQRMVFEPPPSGTRLCVVATNVAETSLTIPDVKYVVDSGKTKEKVFDKVTGVSMFHVTRCSQASANQRAGRAGRVAPGHCYRLYSSAVFNETAKFAKPEIMCRPIDDVVLILKNLHLPVVNFPYPTPPDHVQIRHSLKRLAYLGALLEKNEDGGVTREAKENAHCDKPIQKDTTRITPLGRLMSSFPVAPRYAKMLCLSDQFQLWPYTIALVAALTVQEILVEMPLDNAGQDFDARRSEWRRVRLAWSGTGQRRLLGDLMVLLRAVLEAEENHNTQAFCDQYGLRQKGLHNIRKLRRQLTNEVNMIVPGVNVAMDPHLKVPSREQCCALRQVVLSGSTDRVARRVNTEQFKQPEDKIKWKHAYKTLELEEPVFLPNSSVLKIDKPEWVCYQDIFETNKMFMRGVTAIEPEWLSRFGPLLCKFSEPLSKPSPYYDPERDVIMCSVDATYGRADWSLPRCIVPHPPGPDHYSRFAYHLLQGDVVPGLKQLSGYLHDTATLVRPLALRHQNEKEALTRALRICNVTTRKKLIMVWQKQPKYLLAQYCMWLSDKSCTALVKRMWPPVPEEENEWIVR